MASPLQTAWDTFAPDSESKWGYVDARIDFARANPDPQCQHLHLPEESYPPRLRRFPSPTGSGRWHPPSCTCRRHDCPVPPGDW